MILGPRARAPLSAKAGEIVKIRMLPQIVWNMAEEAGL